MTENKTILKLKKAVEHKFSYFPKTKEVLDLKEELLSIMIDKYNDLKTGTEKQKYKDCMSLMVSSYKEVLHNIELETSRKILKDKLLGFSLFGTIYFMMVVIIYILTSAFIFKNFKNTYFIVLAPSIFFSVVISYFMFQYNRKLKQKVMTRVCLGLLFLSIAVCSFVIPSLYLALYKNINIWHPLWLILLVIGSIYLITDTFMYPNTKPASRLIRNCLNALFVSTTIYLIVSVFSHAWHVTWLIYFLFIIICEVYILLYFKRKI